MKTKVNIMIVLLITLFSSVGCSRLFSSPSSVLKSHINYIEAGRIDDAANLLSSNHIRNRGGIERVKKEITEEAWQLKEKKGFKSFEVEKEEVFGELASVTAKVVLTDGTARIVTCKLVKEDGAWKIDSVEINN